MGLAHLTMLLKRNTVPTAASMRAEPLMAGWSNPSYDAAEGQLRYQQANDDCHLSGSLGGSTQSARNLLRCVVLNMTSTHTPLARPVAARADHPSPDVVRTQLLSCRLTTLVLPSHCRQIPRGVTSPRGAKTVTPRYAHNRLCIRRSPR